MTATVTPTESPASSTGRSASDVDWSRVHRRDLNDCRVLAEAEAVGAAALLTLDRRLRRNLAPHARLRILSPSRYWKELAFPRGTPPQWSPRRGSPLYRAMSLPW